MSFQWLTNWTFFFGPIYIHPCHFCFIILNSIFMYFLVDFEIESDKSHHALFSDATRTFWRNARSAENLPLWVFRNDLWKSVGRFPPFWFSRMQQSFVWESHKLSVRIDWEAIRCCTGNDYLFIYFSLSDWSCSCARNDETSLIRLYPQR